MNKVFRYFTYRFIRKFSQFYISIQGGPAILKKNDEGLSYLDVIESSILSVNPQHETFVFI